MITPHLTSAMAMFGFFATFYVILLMLEIWFAYRPYIVEQAQKRSDLLGRVFKLLTLGSYDVSERSQQHVAIGPRAGQKLLTLQGAMPRETEFNQRCVVGSASLALGQVQVRPTWVCSSNRLATVHVATGTVAIGRGDTRIERGLSARTWHPSASEEWGCGFDRMCRDEVCGIGVAS